MNRRCWDGLRVTPDDDLWETTLSVSVSRALALDIRLRKAGSGRTLVSIEPETRVVHVNSGQENAGDF